MRRSQTPDVCLVLEGTYPYVAGGVSSWTHDLIKAQSHLDFHLLILLPDDQDLTYRYELPENVVGTTQIILRRLRQESFSSKATQSVFRHLAEPLLEFMRRGQLTDLGHLVQILGPHREKIGENALLNSKAAWNLLLQMYRSQLPKDSFLDYFWTWRSSLEALFSILLADLPRAGIYHPVSTGYAGLTAACAHLQHGSPVVLTEHGIYTNERRIEIAVADWLYEIPSQSLDAQHSRKGLRELWIDLFTSYSRVCYEVSERIITLYQGNQVLQLEDGADPQKLEIIPNGIDFDRYSQATRDPGDRPPTVALIGRVVPIKDIKTFIRASAILRESVQNLKAYIFGPTEEDEDYFSECEEMVNWLGLEGTLEFTGKVRLDEYLPKVDVLALTSISEAQPLVILEAGAAGIPTVATDVGACREMILGRSDERLALGPGGAITALSNPQQTAEALRKFLTDPVWYDRCSKAIQQRVEFYYNKYELDATYRKLYQGLLEKDQTIAQTLEETA